MPTSPVSSLRAAIAGRRARRRERARLAREIASFATPVERLELEAILERYTAEQTREIREMLARMAA